jgi:hypothetical protein
MITVFYSLKEENFVTKFYNYHALELSGSWLFLSKHSLVEKKSNTIQNVFNSGNFMSSFNIWRVVELVLFYVTNIL